MLELFALGICFSPWWEGLGEGVDDFNACLARHVPSTDCEVIRRGGYGKPRGLGERPAGTSLSIPSTTTRVRTKPILEQIHEWPSGVGESAWRAIDGWNLHQCFQGQRTACHLHPAGPEDRCL